MKKLFNFWFEFCIAPLYFGGGGGRSSTASATTSTNTDKRLVVSDSAIGISSDNSTINLTTTDGGAVDASFDFAKSANAMTFEFAKSANAIASENFNDLLNTTNNVLSGILGGIASQQNFIAATTADAKGTIDNKTIMTISGIGAVVVAVLAFKGKK